MSVALLSAQICARLAHVEAQQLKIVALTGAVAVGKSTLSRALGKELESQVGVAVPLVATDGFLRSEPELTSAGLLHRKGFPESFDLAKLRVCVDELARGLPVHVPRYDHATRGVSSEQLVQTNGWLIVEGVFAVQPVLASGVPCCTVYLTAPPAQIEAQFMTRVLALLAERGERMTAEREQRIRAIYRDVNLVNLTDHIAPLRAQCDFVVEQRADGELVM